MQDFINSLLENPPVALIVSAIGGFFSVWPEVRRREWWTVLAAVVSGIFIAWILTDPLSDVLRGWLPALGDSTNNAVAGVLGIGGRGLVIWLRETARNPLSIWTKK